MRKSTDSRGGAVSLDKTNIWGLSLYNISVESQTIKVVSKAVVFGK